MANEARGANSRENLRRRAVASNGEVIVSYSYDYVSPESIQVPSFKLREAFWGKQDVDFTDVPDTIFDQITAPPTLTTRPSVDLKLNKLKLTLTSLLPMILQKF